MVLSLALSTLLPIVAGAGLKAPATTSTTVKLNPQISVSSEKQTLAPSPEFCLPVRVTAPTAALAGPRLPGHQPLIANDAEAWFNKNAKTIAIVAVAVIVVLIISN